MFLWFQIHTNNSLFQQLSKGSEFLLFLANTIGSKPWPKIIDSYLLGELTAVHVTLHFLVEALCFCEQEVAVLNRRPLEGLSSFSEKTWHLAISLQSVWELFSRDTFFFVIISTCPQRDVLWAYCLIYVVTPIFFCVGLRRCMSGWPSGTSYSSWRPGIWSNSTTCTVTAFPWSYGSSLPPGLRVRTGEKWLNFWALLWKQFFLLLFANICH